MKNGGIGDYSGIEIPRKSFYLGGWVSYSDWYPNYQLRLFDREKGEWGEDWYTSEGRLNEEILHYPYLDHSPHLLRLDNCSSLKAKELYLIGRRQHWWDFMFRPLLKFFKMFLIRLGFLEGMRGFIISVCGAYYIFLGYAKLFERGGTSR